jgi:hypothetical protein
MRLTKKNTTVSAELDSLKPSLAEKLAAISDYAKLNVADATIYPVQPSQITPWALSIAGLVGLFHLTDGTIDPSTIITCFSMSMSNWSFKFSFGLLRICMLSTAQDIIELRRKLLSYESMHSKRYFSQIFQLFN